MLAIASVPPVYTVSLLFRWWKLVYDLNTGKAWPWWFLITFIESGPAYFSSHLRCHQKATHIKWWSCSNFFWRFAFRCLQLCWTIDWRLFFVLSIQVTLLACVLIGSLAQLKFSFCHQSLLALCRVLMLSLAMWSHQRLLVGFKSPSQYLTHVWWCQEWGHAGLLSFDCIRVSN